MPAWLKFLLVTIGIIVFIIRGGIMVLMPLLKFAVPALLAYGSYKLIKSHFSAAKEKVATNEKSRMRGPGPTIEICSHCGQELGSCHDCPSKRTS